MPDLYKNNGSKGQMLCKVCDARFSPKESRFSSMNLRCPYYLHNLKKVDKKDLQEDYGKNKYKLHYIYRQFTIDFFKINLNSLPA